LFFRVELLGKNECPKPEKWRKKKLNNPEKSNSSPKTLSRTLQSIGRVLAFLVFLHLSLSLEDGKI